MLQSSDGLAAPQEQTQYDPLFGLIYIDSNQVCYSNRKSILVKGCKAVTFRSWNGAGEGCHMIILLFALGAMCCASLAFLAGATWAALPRLRAPMTRRQRSGQGLTLVTAAPVVERESFKLAS
jgi:hypothetical protein